IAPINAPQTILTINGGSRLPFVVILAKIYVAESAEVTKNVATKIIERTDSNVVNGNCSSVTNNALVISSSTSWAIFVPLFRSLYKAVPPKVAIQIIARTGGTTTTPPMNSRIVLPFKTRAPNAPTNGDHAIAQGEYNIAQSFNQVPPLYGTTHKL